MGTVKVKGEDLEYCCNPSILSYPKTNKGERGEQALPVRPHGRNEPYPAFLSCLLDDFGPDGIIQEVFFFSQMGKPHVYPAD